MSRTPDAPLRPNALVATYLHTLGVRNAGAPFFKVPAPGSLNSWGLFVASVGTLLSQMADFYEDKQLTMKQFLVVLAIGYVLDAIPDLLEVKPKFHASHAGGRGGGELTTSP